RVALAVGRLDPNGASAVVISPTGLVLTAYHAASSCVARLRRNPDTRSSFHSDGSYYGEHGPLPCEGSSIRFPHPSCAGPPYLESARPLYLVAVPPVRRAIIVDQIELFFRPREPSDEYPVPVSDYALLKTDGEFPSYLSLSESP